MDAGRPYDDSLNDFDLDYLEAELVRLAVAAKTSDPDNQNRGNRRKVDEFRQNELDQYFDEALFLLDLIGVRAFGNQSEKKKIAPAPSILPEPATSSLKLCRESRRFRMRLSGRANS